MLGFASAFGAGTLAFVQRTRKLCRQAGPDTFSIGS